MGKKVPEKRLRSVRAAIKEIFLVSVIDDCVFSEKKGVSNQIWTDRTRDGVYREIGSIDFSVQIMLKSSV